MKRFLPLLAIVALTLPAYMPARAADVSVNFFYENLDRGNWYQVADYGYVWQPDVATNESWRPYSDGYWSYTDQGWTWVSYEDFGWATYHYGRWARLADYGWCWVPGTEWGPAWVSWRTGGNYVGWAPLPPRGERFETVYDSRPISGPVDIEFGIGPSFYNFIDLRYIGEPVLRDRIYGYDRNVVFLERTVNVTNIIYNNSVVYNYGPDFSVVSRYSTRPIPRLTIERENIDPRQALQAGDIYKVQGNKLLLAAPQRVTRGEGAQFAPKVVKAKIEQPKLEKGWANLNNPGEKNRLEQKFKAENPKNVSKPDLQPSNNGAANAAAADVNSNPAAGVGAQNQMMERNGKGKRKAEKFQAQPAASLAPGASPDANTNAQQFERQGGGKGKKNKGQRFENQPAAAPGSSPGAEGTAQDVNQPSERHKNKKGDRQERQMNMQGGQNGNALDNGSGMTKQERKAERRAERMGNPNAGGGQNLQANPNVGGNPDNGAGQTKQERKAERRAERLGNPNAGGGQDSQANPNAGGNPDNGTGQTKQERKAERRAERMGNANADVGQNPQVNPHVGGNPDDGGGMNKRERKMQRQQERAAMQGQGQPNGQGQPLSPAPAQDNGGKKKKNSEPAPSPTP